MSVQTVPIIAQALSGLALVTPQQVIQYQPTSAPGQSWSTPPPPFIFQTEGENKFHFESDITDNYAEDNTALQDQIANRPPVISVHGFVSELNDIASLSLFELAQIVSALTTIEDFTPPLSTSALNAYNNAVQTAIAAQNVVNGVAAWSSIGTGPNVIGPGGLGTAFNPQTGQVANSQTNQQIAFQQWYGYWEIHALFTVQTQWATMVNMAIQSVDAIQDEKSESMTDFMVTFKRMNFANTTSFGTPVATARAAQQNSTQVQQGTNTLTDDGSSTSQLF